MKTIPKTTKPKGINKMTNIHRNNLISKYFKQDIDISKSQTIKVINEYIKESKKDAHINDCPVQLTIKNGRCTNIELGSGYNHQYRITTWRNYWFTNRDIIKSVEISFRRASGELI